MSNPLAEVMDQLCIIHHKLDVLLHVAGIPVPPMNDGHLCPGCNQPIEYATDFISKCIVRRCGCGHQKLAPLVGLEDLGEQRYGQRHDHAIRNRSDSSGDDGGEAEDS